MSVLLDCKTCYYLWTNVVMFGDLVTVGLFVWPTTSFDPLLAIFKFRKKGFGKGKKDNIRVSIWMLGISLTLPVATVFSRHSNWSRENEMNSALYKQNRLTCYTRYVWLPDTIEAARRAAEPRERTWVCNIIQSAGWLRRLGQGARKGQVDHSSVSVSQTSPEVCG